MRQCNMSEAKTNLSQLVNIALGGEEVLITKAGKPMVRLVPVIAPLAATGGFGALSINPADLDAGFTPEVEDEVAALLQSGCKREAVEQMRLFRRGLRLNGLSLQEMIEEGRR